MRTCVLLAFAVLLTPLQPQRLLAQSDNFLNVSGSAEIQVVPDRVVISVGVESRAPSLQAAKLENDAAIAAVLAVTRTEQVAAGDVQTGFIEISPVYQDRDPNRGREGFRVDYYRVSKSMTITLRDVSRFERLLTGVVNAGANRVHGVEFQTSELRKYRDQAREAAVRAAVEKAESMAKAAGLRVGKATRISNFQDALPFRQNSGIQNTSFAAGGEADSDPTTSVGRISVSATVDMTFPLLP